MVQNFNIQNQNQQENQNQNQNPRPHVRDRGMAEYEQATVEWNRRNDVADSHERRRDAINNTPGYFTGNRVHHLRSIQMVHHADWDALFGNHILNPTLAQYAQAAMDHFHDDADTLDFAGQMSVSLLMQENYHPGIHLAIYFIHLTPHRCFHDGHMISVEFGEGSATHQAITRLFDTDDRAMVFQATEYQMLSSLANDDDAMELLYTCFVPEFAPMRFSLVAPPNAVDAGDGYYVPDQNALDDHRWHDFAEYYNEIRNRNLAAVAAVEQHEEQAQEQEQEQAQAQVQIPPPLPINNFVEIYQRALREYDADAQEQPQHQDNIIPYDSDDDDQEEVHANG
jgi:hypothetical protein